jgi:hypothetical protein
VTNGKKILLVATKILLVAMKGVAVDGSLAADGLWSQIV